MAEEFDVTARLTEGGPAVETVQQYVWACQQIGYQHPDLTAHAVQIQDRYGAEHGMDLAALHSDWLAFEDVVRAAHDALAVQERQLSVLSAAWQGAGADASREFLRRHGEASASAVAAVCTAADALGALRESLWQAVDTKVGAVIAIEGRAQADRTEWLAAAATVTTGAGDRAVAAELVDQAVKPFVDSSIRDDWLEATRTATSSVTGAYQRAADEVAAEHQPVFDVPGDLGPTWSRPPAYTHHDPGFREQLAAPAPAGPPAPAATAPSGWSTLPAAPPPAPLPEVAVPPAPSLPSQGGMGTGLPGVGSGLPGLGQQFADMLSGLLGGSESAAPEVPDLDVPELEDPPDLEDEDDAAGDEDADADDEEAGDEELDEEVVGEAPGEELYEPPAEPAPAPTPAPPPAEPLPPADLPAVDPLAAEQTPCAIAADEVPQVGDPPE